MSEGDPREPSMPAEPARVTSARGPRRARSPEYRPRWLVMLSLLTLLYGGKLFIGGLSELRDPLVAVPGPVREGLTPAQDALVRRFDEVRSRVTADHRRALRAQAVVSIAEGLVLLLAAAAALSRDRRGRAVAMAAAWSGIAFQLAALWLRYPVFRDLSSVGPIWAELVSLDATPEQAKEMTPERLAQILRMVPIFMAAGGILGSLVLLRMFGGRRGRVLYGLERPRGVRPS
jgi:hypothetical protein